MKRVDEIIEGLTILKQYCKSGYGADAEHDVLYYSVDYDAVMHAENKERLVELHWFEEAPNVWGKFT